MKIEPKVEMGLPRTELARVFEKDLDRILHLYAIDETFAEICRDFVALAKARSDATDALPDIQASLQGLAEEIRDRLALDPGDQRSGNANEPLIVPRG